jgi:hypothetical protein
MKLAILTCVTLLIGAGYIYTASGVQAGGVALDDAGCQIAWTMASPNGATLSKDEAVPFILDFTMADTNNDGAIDANEFTTACQGGYSTFFKVEATAQACPAGTSLHCHQGICYCR